MKLFRLQDKSKLRKVSRDCSWIVELLVLKIKVAGISSSLFPEDPFVSFILFKAHEFIKTSIIS